MDSLICKHPSEMKFSLLGDMQDEESVAQAQESIAAEVDLGGNAMRAMWRSTCYKVTFTHYAPVSPYFMQEHQCEGVQGSFD